MVEEQKIPKKSIRKVFPPININRKNTALLIIDMQYLDAHWDYGFTLQLRNRGHENGMAYFKERLQTVTLNIKRLQDKFREKGIEVIHIRIKSLTMDGRDRSRMHKVLDVFAPPNSKDAEILDELKPKNDEIVIDKTSASVFNSTNIDYILRNLGIECLVLTGVMTSGCIEGAARDSCEKGYNVILVEDACGERFEENHKSAINRIANTWAAIKGTEEVIQILNKL